MAYDRKDNFYHFWCAQTENGWKYRTACQTTIEKIVAEDAGFMAANPDCVRAIQKGRCPAMAMAEEEIDKGATIFYVDRDDRGPGVVRRETPRPANVIAQHHALLERLGVTANNSVSNVTQRYIARTVTPPAEENAFDMSDFDIGKVITKHVAALGAV